MMPTVGRLKTRPQFLKVAAAKRKWVMPGLVLQAARRQHGEDRAAPVVPKTPAPLENAMPEADKPKLEEPEVRVGFTVTRKVGNAVIRNRAKRRLRAVAAELFPRLGRAGTDYVVIGRIGTLTRPFEALREDLKQAILKLDRPGDGNKPDRARRDRRPARDKHRRPKEASQ